VRFYDKALSALIKKCLSERIKSSVHEKIRIIFCSYFTPYGATGATGATGAGLAEFAYIYNLGLQVVPVEGDILFSNNCR